MDHVSTLCALSTVGIAPTGLALGRVERSKPKIFRRKTLPYEPPVLPTPPEATPVDVRPKTSRSNRPSLAAVDWTINEKEPATEGGNIPRGNQFQEPDLRRASLSFGAARYRRRGQTLTNPPLRIPEHAPTESNEAESHSRRPSTSWLRRLSILANIELRTSSLNALRQDVPTPPPSLFVNTAVSPGSALRRPATSYQRSETMRLQTPITPDFESRFSQQFPRADSPAIEEFEFQSQEDWKPFLLPKAQGFSEKLSRRLSTATAPIAQSVRRLVSDSDTLPALISATTIINKTAVPRDEPAEPAQFRNPFQAPVENAAPGPRPLPTSKPEPKSGSALPPKTSPSEAPPSPALPPSPKKPAHKHSYSFNDLVPKRIVVNTVTATGAPIIGPRGGSLKRVKGRTFSIPRSEISRLEKVHPNLPSAPKRRNITDPAVFRRPPPLTSPELPGSTFNGQSAGLPRSVSHDYNIGLRHHRPLTTDASCTLFSPAPPKRHSIAASDPASTIIGSDDTRVFTSGDEYETDFMTDYWDSIRTRGTQGSGMKGVNGLNGVDGMNELSGLNGLRIETMFDKAGTQLSNEEVATLEDLLPRGSFASRVEKDPPLFSDSLLPAVTRVRTDDNLSFFDDDDDDSHSMIGALPGERDGPSLQMPTAFPLSSPLELSGPSSPSMLFADSHAEKLQPSQKMNIFDWSEQTRLDRDQSDSEARPSTVHGKQNAIDRGSRAACRKVPSSIHLRSQSVPVARELPPNDSRQTSGKFGTWGLGSKGVSEDWDSDFDFDDGEEEDIPSQKTKSTESEAPAQSMTVPQAILERQASLRGQYGQVQELTLLVEELKRLRHQASVLDLVGGPSSELWKEAESIVNLATIDDEENQRSPPGSPLSLTFSFDDSDDEGLTVPSTKRDSDGSWRSAAKQETTLNLPLRQPKRDNEGSWQETSTNNNQPYSQPLRQLSKSSPKSKSVLDILQPTRGHDRSATLPDLRPSSRTQKLPFDTSSLRNLVVRAGVVTRALKEVIRKAEGVDPNPQGMFPSDPPFRRIFDQPSHDDLASFEAALAEMH
ncbi:hypothetical protein N7509_003701 [Penicillium cosmopolitanum]|uniref:Uncharacterized protein n=1 Tax=Penicillium cosmopolitanum TaxID=1131564 RepID=A0A9W9W5I9_9EURO|nr:uncharacterized protein N7509_003701 [Penicillium cosmopolitanum]KAJ5403830.1 hypothetical protein N7509_003701 [Penicillium cosmopolitanum]